MSIRNEILKHEAFGVHVGLRPVLQAITELLAFNADPCLPLTHGVGTVLCIAASTEYEARRTPDNRLKLVSVGVSRFIGICRHVSLFVRIYFRYSVTLYHMFNTCILVSISFKNAYMYE